MDTLLHTKIHASACVYVSCARVERVNRVRVAAGNVHVLEYQQRSALTSLHIFLSRKESNASAIP